MKPFNSYEVLREFSRSELAGVVEQLNGTGLVTDQDGLCLGAAVIEYWSRKCTALIRQHGYDGGELAVRGQFFTGVGAIYALYDEVRHTGANAADELQRAANRER